MPQPTVEIVRDLTLKLNRFKDLARSFGPELQSENISYSVSLSYLRLRFSAEDILQIDFWSNKIDARDDIKKHFSALADKIEGDVVLSPEITIAESIAKVAYLCASGDDYHPGYFSEIIVDDEKIVLRQTNWTNAKSSSHKNDYLMRDLEFVIPSEGEMQVKFSDRSSKNNKNCGDRIRQALDEANLKYDRI